MTLAPAVYGYGLATVDITYHEACFNGQPPRNVVSQPESTITSEDICSPLPPKHTFEIDAYAFKATPLTEDTTYRCHAVGIFSNAKCAGFPETVIPLFPGEEEAETPCIQDVYWDSDLSVRLLCEHDHGHDHGHGDWKGHDDGAKGYGSEHERRQLNMPEIEDLTKDQKAPETFGNDNLVGSLNLNG